VRLSESKAFRESFGRMLTHATLIALSAVFLLPFFWMVSTSLKEEADIFKLPPEWIPDPIKWANYPDAIGTIAFGPCLRNTLYVCVIVVLGTALSSSLVAYSFSRIRWPGRDVAFIAVLSTMMLPYQTTLIPLFVLFKAVGWTGSFKPLWVPALFGNAFYIFLLRQFFMTVPADLTDAARIDGCSEFGIYSRIILPLAKPALATVILFTFIWTWSDFLNPLIYLQDDRQYTLAVALQQFQSHHEMAWAQLMAASTMIAAPIVALFFFTQRTFIQGVTLTGMKG